MFRKQFITLCLLFCVVASRAQQFIGNALADYTSIQLIPYNPAWVNNIPNDHTEVHVFSTSFLAGTNAFMFDKKWLLGGYKGQAIEGEQYARNNRKYTKHMWANADVLGPAYSFTYKEEHHIGIYMRYREIVTGGGLNVDEFKLIGGGLDPATFGTNYNFKNAGFTIHDFAEIGITYGRVLQNDDYHIARAGVTLKYLMGFSGGSIYTNSMKYNRKDADTIGSLSGDLNVNYTYNINQLIDNDASNDRGAWFDRGGKAGLGIDIGVQYEFHPNGTPNEKTPYLYSVSASITDVGAVTYAADKNSGTYNYQIARLKYDNIKRENNEDPVYYFERLKTDSAIALVKSAKTFSIGLPTALRLNGDWNVIGDFNLATGILLNLRGSSSTIYRPAYTSYVNITPSYTFFKFLRASIPFTFYSHQAVAVGTVLRAGPVYIGSGSFISSIVMSEEVNNMDFFLGLAFKLERQHNYYTY